MTTFAEAIAAVPFSGTSSAATGLLAPIMRATGHILYAVAANADEGYTITDEEVRRELEHAAGHLHSTVSTADAAPISTVCKERVRAFCEATLAAGLEWSDWPEAERGNNLRHLANRAAALGVIFDQELAGVRGSDAGSSL